jgi:hypothetical protein
LYLGGLRKIKAVFSPKERKQKKETKKLEKQVGENAA